MIDDQHHRAVSARQVAASRRWPKRGKLIAITSGMGSIGEMLGGYVPYRTSKAALNMAWHSLALEAQALRRCRASCSIPAG